MSKTSRCPSKPTKLTGKNPSQPESYATAPIGICGVVEPHLGIALIDATGSVPFQEALRGGVRRQMQTAVSAGQGGFGLCAGSKASCLGMSG